MGARQKMNAVMKLNRMAWLESMSSLWQILNITENIELHRMAMIRYIMVFRFYLSTKGRSHFLISGKVGRWVPG